MKAFSENHPAVIIGNLANELEEFKNKYKKLQTNYQSLNRLLQTKQNFQERG